MPDYTKSTIAGCPLYFTSPCTVEAFHARADVNRSKNSSAEFFIRSDGTVVAAKKGRLRQKTINTIVEYIAINHQEMQPHVLSAQHRTYAADLPQSLYPAALF